MKWRVRFVWMKARPVATFFLLMAVPFLPVVPWVMAAGPDPGPFTPPPQDPQVISLEAPIPQGAADDGSFRGPSLPLDPRASRKAARRWEFKALDPDWNLLMTNRFAVRGDIRKDDLQSVGAFAECFLDAVHELVKGDLTDLRLSIRVFKDETDFDHWASCHQLKGGLSPEARQELIDGDRNGAKGEYHRPSAELVLLFGPSTDVAQFCGRLMRGVTLEYLDRAKEFRGPDEIAEGIADWFADYVVHKGRVAPRLNRSDVASLLEIKDPARLKEAWAAWSQGSP
jgi:hypothetical protein